MAIIDTLDVYQFREAFKSMNRDANFSYEGLGALFDWFEELSEEMGTPVELDVIAICCDYAESTAEEIAADYGDEFDCEIDPDDDDELKDAAREYLADNTSYVEFEYMKGGTGFIYAQF